MPQPKETWTYAADAKWTPRSILRAAQAPIPQSAAPTPTPENLDNYIHRNELDALQTLILEALQPFPQARSAVAKAFRRVSGESPDPPITHQTALQ